MPRRRSALYKACGLTSNSFGEGVPEAIEEGVTVSSVEAEVGEKADV